MNGVSTPLEDIFRQPGGIGNGIAESIQCFYLNAAYDLIIVGRKFVIDQFWIEAGFYLPFAVKIKYAAYQFGRQAFPLAVFLQAINNAVRGRQSFQRIGKSAVRLGFNSNYFGAVGN